MPLFANQTLSEYRVRRPPGLGTASCHGLFSGLDWQVGGDQLVAVPGGLVDLFVL